MRCPKNICFLGYPVPPCVGAVFSYCAFTFEVEKSDQIASSYTVHSETSHESGIRTPLKIGNADSIIVRVDTEFWRLPLPWD